MNELSLLGLVIFLPIVLGFGLALATRLRERRARHRFVRAKGMNVLAESAPRRSRPKPEWVRREVIRLKSLLPDHGCRKVADIFNRMHDESGRTKERVGKTYVARVIRDHQREILALRQLQKRPPRRLPRNLIWAMDLTYLSSPSGPVAVAGLLDHGSRASLALRPVRSRSAIALLRLVLDAVERFGTPRFLRTDNEPAFRSWLWRLGLRLLGICPRRTRPFAPWENGRIERFFGTLKNRVRAARAAGYDLSGSSELPLELARFQAWYNHLRPHQHLGGQTPAEAWNRRPSLFGSGRTLYSEWGGALRGFG